MMIWMLEIWTTKPSLLHQRIAAGDDRLHRLDPRALADLDEVLQRDRHADGGDQRRQPERAAQRPVGDPLDRPAPHRGERHGDGDDQQQREDQEEERCGGADAENDQRDQADKRADHEDVAMGEVDHADDPVDHRVADRDQPVDRSERHAIDQLLE